MVEPTRNMDQERHQNAAKAAYFWLSQGLTLREIFELAIETGQCKYNIKIYLTFKLGLFLQSKFPMEMKYEEDNVYFF